MDPAEKQPGIPPSRFAPLTPLTLPAVHESRDEATTSAGDSAGDSTASSVPFHKSAPTTPRATDPPRPVHPIRGLTITDLPKSKSTPYLSNTSRHLLPLPPRRKKSKRKTTAAFEPSWAEVCARIGSGIVKGAHETQGLPWDTPRAGGLLDYRDEYFFKDPAEIGSRLTSRAASRVPSRSASTVASPVQSRFASRSHSRVGLASSAPRTPAEGRASGDYFGAEEEEVDEGLFAPDFLAQLEAERAEEEDDGFDGEEYLRQLESRAPWSWFRWLFGPKTDAAGDEEEEDDDDDEEEKQLAAEQKRNHSGAIEPVDPATVLPPHAYAGGWHDVVWFSALAVRALFT